MKSNTYAASTLLAATSALVFTVPAFADGKIRLDLPRQSLQVTLRTIAATAGREIMIDADAVSGLDAPALSGEFSTEDAVAAAVQGTGLQVRYAGNTILVGNPGSGRSDATVPGGDITVTGSRIKGAPISSPVITIARQAIEDGGFPDLGAAMRALPQNFGGGQNPTVGFGAGSGGIANQNVTGGSAVNLRGLGGDATLTLLNANRLSYGGL